MIGVVEQYDKWGRPEKGKVGDDTVNSHVKLLSRLMNRAVDVWGFMLRDMPKWPRHKVAPDFRTREVTLDELVTLARVWRETYGRRWRSCSRRMPRERNASHCGRTSTSPSA